MFSEIATLMNHIVEGADINELLDLNVFNKRSADNLYKTNKYLKQLYLLNLDQLAFRVFVHYWKITDQAAKPVLSLLFALSNDTLLSQSIDVVVDAKLGVKLPVEKFDDNIEKYYPDNYSTNTRRSAAQNIASSWKQAGYMLGKVKNIRTAVAQNQYTAAFACLLAYLEGKRGEYILLSKYIKALALSTSELQVLLRAANNADLINFQSGGNVTTISFENQL
jgi:hypothetical protein